MEEVWKDIEGYEGLYQISNFGNVRSLNWGKRGIVKNLYLKKHNKGYYHVELAKDGVRKAFTVHRLVATAFIENPNNYPFINHKDENKKNNFVGNLEWCTPSYNAKYFLERHADRKKCYVNNGRPKCSFSPSKHKSPIIQISKYGETIKIWKNVSTVGRETGWKTSSIIDCCKNKRKHAYGFCWRFSS